MTDGEVWYRAADLGNSWAFADTRRDEMERVLHEIAAAWSLDLEQPG